VSDGRFYEIWAASRWVYDQPDLSKQERAVLLVLISHVNPDTGLAFPSQERLARLTGWSERNVWGALKSLEGRGLIERKARWRADGSHRREVDLVTLTLPAGIANRYRRDAWDAPDDEMFNPAEWLDGATNSQPVRSNESSLKKKEK
jgi:DNA-binding MarR family transcriptional regulator